MAKNYRPVDWVLYRLLYKIKSFWWFKARGDLKSEIYFKSLNLVNKGLVIIPLFSFYSSNLINRE